jgi:3',5'-cyclic AMP phosphodiesterase CpdA
MDERANGGPDRRGLLKCMAWAGTGALWSVSGGLLSSVPLEAAEAAPKAKAFTFVQVSDSHVGFAKPANPDARVTYREAIAKIKALPEPPDFIFHTGDITQLARDSEFDDADQIIRESGMEVFHIPGEHDMLDDGQGKAYLDRYGKGSQGDGWYSFDHKGVHFVALINVKDLKAGGMGSLGAAQLSWLEKDLSGHGASTPVVVLAHIPLWTLYADWGWGTDDSAQALSFLKKFGSVTVLNGHIHQIQQHVEGNISFHTARSTAFPQPAPGQGPAPGPLKVPDDKLRSVLGVRQVNVVPGAGPIPLIDTPLAS